MTEYFKELTDPRQQAKVMHNFAEIVMMVVCAVIAGCDVWEDIADYCRVKEQYLARWRLWKQQKKAMAV